MVMRYFIITSVSLEQRFANRDLLLYFAIVLELRLLHFKRLRFLFPCEFFKEDTLDFFCSAALLTQTLDYLLFLDVLLLFLDLVE